MNYQDASPTAIVGATAKTESRPPRSRVRVERVKAQASAIDFHVGRRLRERRVMLGLSQQQMAQALGVAYQQFHKYERGINRISAGRLFDIAQRLSVPIDFFYDGLTDPPVDRLSQRQRLCLELVRNFSRIDKEPLRMALSQLTRALAEEA